MRNGATNTWTTVRSAEDFECVIGQDVMCCPVLAPDGHHYERVRWKKYVKTQLETDDGHLHHLKSPLTRAILDHGEAYDDWKF